MVLQECSGNGFLYFAFNSLLHKKFKEVRKFLANKKPGDLDSQEVQQFKGLIGSTEEGGQDLCSWKNNYYL